MPRGGPTSISANGEMIRAAYTKRAAWIAAVCVVFALGLVPLCSTSAQQRRARYFEETGHNVYGDFLEFYEKHGGLAIFGYPLTGEFTVDGRQVQYFQRARMELHPESPEPYNVQLGLLGDELGYRQPPILESDIPPPGHPDKRYFAETGHTVTFTFLEFFESSGGLDIFGYPISEWGFEPDGRIVQYFQRAKMEWYPENPAGQRVQLGMLGTIYVQQNVDSRYTGREDPLILSRTLPPTPLTPEQTSIPADVMAITVRASLKHPIIGLYGAQTAYVYVFDQSSYGVPGTSVEMQVQYADGRSEVIPLAGTNANGYSQIEFSVEDLTPGQVVLVNLSARYGDLTANASAAFLPWW